MFPRFRICGVKLCWALASQSLATGFQGPNLWLGCVETAGVNLTCYLPEAATWPLSSGLAKESVIS